MIELYVFVILSSLGYITAKNTSNTKNRKLTSISPTLQVIPDRTNIHLNNFKKSKEIESKIMNQKYQNKTNVLKNVQSKHYYDSKLSGESMTTTEFTHNNMVPFFGGNVKQNMNLDQTNVKLEHFTGINDVVIEKKDNICFGDNFENTLNNNNKGYLTELDRMEVSNFQNNVNPIEKIYVGPGTDTNDKYQSNPSGGYFDHNYRDMLSKSYKTVDELRVDTKPKESYNARVVSGQKMSLPGKQSKFSKNKTNTFYEKSQDNYFKTTGAYVKAAKRPCNIINENNRKTTTSSYKGVPFVNKGQKLNSRVQSDKKHSLDEFGNRNANAESIGVGFNNDYGRTNVQIYSNERDITNIRTYEGNLTSIVKSIVAPIQDVINPTVKEYTVLNNRYGNFQNTAPNKQTSYDPNDITRTTLKETIIHDNNSGNIKTYEKQTIYDPNDVARTTIKETTIEDTSSGIVTGRVKNIVYDPSEVAKTTMRQLLDNYENTINMHGMNKQTVYDPNDVAKTTLKETIENTHRDGNINSLQGNDGYKTTNMNANITNKQILSDHQHIGNTNYQKSDAYKNTKHNLSVTNKQILADNDYYGGVNSSHEEMKSYENIYNAVMNDTKEMLYQNRKPTKNSVKNASSSDNVNLTSIKNDNNENEKFYHTSINNEIPSTNLINNTKTPFTCEKSNRLDSELVSAFLNNPYTHSLTNAV